MKITIDIKNLPDGEYITRPTHVNRNIRRIVVVENKKVRLKEGKKWFRLHFFFKVNDLLEVCTNVK